MPLVVHWQQLIPPKLSTEQKEETPEEIKTNPEVTAFWNRLSQEASTNSLKDFEELIKSDEFSYNGVTYRFVPVNWKNKPVVEKLRIDASTIDQDKDWEKYANNVKQRALILIEGLTEEQFDTGDYDTIEDVVTAWSIRAIRGFRRKKQGLQSVL